MKTKIANFEIVKVVTNPTTLSQPRIITLTGTDITSIEPYICAITTAVMTATLIEAFSGTGMIVICVVAAGILAAVVRRTV